MPDKQPRMLRIYLRSGQELIFEREDIFEYCEKIGVQKYGVPDGFDGFNFKSWFEDFGKALAHNSCTHLYSDIFYIDKNAVEAMALWG